MSDTLPLKPTKWQNIKKYIMPLVERLPVTVGVLEMEQIDSSDITPDYWIAIAKEIGKNYYKYSGFVIIHGTDTLAYTASGLSFLLENIAKPVILTGAQIPVSSPRNDALQNLVGSIMIASHGAFNILLVPEVCVFFNGLLFRGNRATKLDTSSFDAFISPNYPAIGKMDLSVEIYDQYVNRPNGCEFVVYGHMDKNIVIINIYPGIDLHFLEQTLRAPNIKGVILQTYGSGNAPTNREFLNIIENAAQTLSICNITQCLKGRVNMDAYETGSGLKQAGVVSGFDMTLECAFAKMKFLFGKGYEKQAVDKYMEQDLRGELTPG